MWAVRRHCPHQKNITLSRNLQPENINHDQNKEMLKMAKNYSETINVKRIVFFEALNCSFYGNPKYQIIAEVNDGSFMKL